MSSERDKLANYFQEHREDEGEWEVEPEAAEVKPESSLVYSLRMRPSELAEFRRVARLKGVPVSELIRESALMYLRQSETTGIQVSAGKDNKIVYFGSPRSRSAGTRGDPDSTASLPMEPLVATG